MPKSAHYFFPGKNRIRKIREKSGYETPGIFGQILLFGNKMVKMAESLTLRKSAHCFFPGKNRIRKIREKSGYEISYICGQILRLDSIIVRYKEKCRSFFVIFTNFVIFNISIFKATSRSKKFFSTEGLAPVCTVKNH